jgi:hypothetical protein
MYILFILSCYKDTEPGLRSTTNTSPLSYTPTTSVVNTSLHYDPNTSTHHCHFYPTPYLGMSRRSIHTSYTPECFRFNGLRRHLRHYLFPRYAYHLLTSTTTYSSFLALFIALLGSFAWLASLWTAGAQPGEFFNSELPPSMLRAHA